MQSTVIVVPCYNEAGRFRAEAFHAAAQADSSLKFVLVDDGSKDDTRLVLERLAERKRSQFEVLSLAKNSGKAEAVRAGLQRAFELSPALVGYLDADLATPLGELAGLRACFDENSEVLAVLGSRVGLLGRNVVRSHQRHYLGRVFASVASLALGITIYDTQCGAKLFRNTGAIRQAFSAPFETRWTFDVELIARLGALANAGAIPALERSAAEHPLHTWQDVSGSKLGLKAAIGAGLDLAKLWVRYRVGRQDRVLGAELAGDQPSGSGHSERSPSSVPGSGVEASNGSSPHHVGRAEGRLPH
jgi:glycosyltransferase involved in cell wall biosynthesis